LEIHYEAYDSLFLNELTVKSKIKKENNPLKLPINTYKDNQNNQSFWMLIIIIL